MSKYAEIFQKYYKKQNIIGIGTGKTIKKFIDEINIEIVKNVNFISSSNKTYELLNEKSLKVADLKNQHILDIYFDSADFVDENHNLIKGGGAALLKEKISMSISDKNIIIVNNYKMVNTFDGFFVPVEIVQSSLGYFLEILKKEKLKFKIRINDQTKSFLITENNNFLIDVEFNSSFLKGCKQIVGVVEHGYFANEIFNPQIEII